MFKKSRVNFNSEIAKFISDNPANSRKKIKGKHIRFHNKGNRYIFNYETIYCDYKDPVVQEARGAILEIDEEIGSISVVCWPFRKFGNYQESYADNIDWSSAKVQEKVDGSIIKLYFYDGEWTWATNGMIEAADALTQSSDFMSLIKNCINYNKIPYGRLNKDYTYIFELVTKENRVVIDYNEEKLYHLGTRSNISGKECDEDIGITKPAMYELSSLEACIEAAHSLNEGGIVKKEGFVVVDKNYNRVKIKSPAYLNVHNIATGCITKKQFLQAISLDIDISQYITDSLLEIQYLYYKYKYMEMKRDIEQLLVYARGLYEEYEHDRKAVALGISKSKYASLMFKDLESNRTAEEIVKELKYSYVDNAIETYQHKEVWE